MNSDKHDRAKKCLDRASLITDRIKAAVEPTKIAAEISSALLYKISESKFVPSSSRFKVPFPSTSPAGGSEISEGYRLVTLVTGGLKEGHPLEYLIALLVAKFSPTPLPGPKKRDRRITFASIVAALSTLANDHDLEGDLRRICEAAHEEAAELAAAAVCQSHSDTFGEMQRGIQAILKMKYNHGKFSRHVAAAHEARRNLLQNFGDDLYKAEIIRETIRILTAAGASFYPKSNSARWRDVFIAAGMSTYPQERNGSVSGDG